MQKNDFEKQVQQQLDDFSMVPADAVWKNVQKRVEQDKKRRRTLFLWMLAGILVGGGGAGYLLITNNNGSSDTKVTSIPAEKPATGLSNKVQKEDNTGEDDNLYADKNNSNSTTADNSAGTTDVLTEHKIANGSNIISKRISQPLKQKDGRITIVKAPDNIITVQQLQLGKAITENAHELSQKKLNETITETTESTSLAEEKATSKPTPLTGENSVVPTKKVISKSKKSLQFGFTALMGISDNVQSVPVFSQEKSMDRSMQFFSPAASQQSMGTDIAIPDYSSSFSWGAGVFAQLDIGKKWAITAGLNYQLVAAKLNVGMRVDSVKTFQDSALQKTATVSTFFRAGKTTTFINRYHLLELPVNFQYQVNRNPNKPFILSAGLTAGILIGSNSLYLNRKARSYYEERDQFKNLMLHAQSGVAFTLLNQRKYSIAAGPQLQYQLNNLTKPVHSSEHLWFMGLKANILIKKD